MSAEGAPRTSESNKHALVAALNAASLSGLDADFEVLGADRDEKLEDAIKYKFTIKPTYVSRYR
jgi:hypothetical protein